MKNLYILTGLLVFTTNLYAQVAINTDGTSPDNSAMLDVKSTTKGLLAPRMTIAQRNAIVSPAKGLMVFCTDNNQYYSNRGTPAAPEWTMLTSPWAASGSNIYYNSGNVGIGTPNPGYKLDVTGSGFFSSGITGNTSTPYQAAVYGSSQASDHDYGIYGVSNTPTGVAIYGYATEGLAGYFAGELAVSGRVQTMGGVEFSDGSIQTTANVHTIGESYGGGIVFYVYDGGLHGLIAATEDQSTGIPWYNGTYRITGTSGSGLNAGAMNTVLITATQLADNQGGNFAAKVCADHSVTVGGITYGDWYLPSRYELHLLYLQKNVVGGFVDDYYWSSSELTESYAYPEYFGNGFNGFNWKSWNYRVRAIRAF